MRITDYSEAILTCSEKNKSSSAIAREIGVHQSTVSRFLATFTDGSYHMNILAKKIFGSKDIALVIDDTGIMKRYAQEIEGVSSFFDQSTKTFANGYKIVMAALTDGTTMVPLDFEQWIAKFITGNTYQTKIQLAQQLIVRAHTYGFNIKHCVLDGLYFAKTLIDFFDANSIKFIMKAKTTTKVIYQGKKVQLKECKDLRLNSNQSCKKIKAQWNGKWYWFIAVQRLSTSHF